MRKVRKNPRSLRKEELNFFDFDSMARAFPAIAIIPFEIHVNFAHFSLRKCMYKSQYELAAVKI